MAEGKSMSFEDSIDRLKQIVDLLEKGDAPLAESMALFEEGAGLVRSCEKLLEEAEQKVVLLQKSQDGTPEEKPYE